MPIETLIARPVPKRGQRGSSVTVNRLLSMECVTAADNRTTTALPSTGEPSRGQPARPGRNPTSDDRKMRAARSIGKTSSQYLAALIFLPLTQLNLEVSRLIGMRNESQRAQQPQPQ